MMTAAAARRAGFGIHCTVGGTRPDRPSGNLLLLDYFGATLHFSPMNTANPSPEEDAALVRLSERVVEETGGYWIPAGGTMPEAEPGYMNAILEIAVQRGGALRLRSRRARVRDGVDDDRRSARARARRV